jgi:hypothetical protein
MKVCPNNLQKLSQGCQLSSEMYDITGRVNFRISNEGGERSARQQKGGGGGGGDGTADTTHKSHVPGSEQGRHSSTCRKNV